MVCKIFLINFMKNKKIQTCCFSKNHTELRINDINFVPKEEKKPEIDICKILTIYNLKL